MPLVGWMYCTKPEDPLAADTTLVISPGPLSCLCHSLTVSASGPAAEVWPEGLGKFSSTERCGSRASLYSETARANSCTPDQGWYVGGNFGNNALRSSMAHHPSLSVREERRN